MAVTYLCDICKKELDKFKRITILGLSRVEFEELCEECWQVAETRLVKLAKQYIKPVK